MMESVPGAVATGLQFGKIDCRVVQTRSLPLPVLTSAQSKTRLTPNTTSFSRRSLIKFQPLRRNHQLNKEKTEMSETGAQTQLEFAPGTFCWAELATTDGPGAKKFYGSLVGREADDLPVRPALDST